MSEGLAQLQACVNLLLTEVRDLRKAVAANADPTRPLTAEEMCERWHIVAPQPELRLLYLARKCRLHGLQPLKGGSGWNALYLRADVLRAEEHAAGKIRGRKPKGRKAA
jgi:hypothetical protein